MKQVQRGFTLIELMIVVAIIGILAAIAIPSYQDYTARAQVAEAVTLGSSFKTGLAEFHQTTGGFSGALKPTQIATTTSGKYVGNVTFASGATGGTITIVSVMKAGGIARELLGKTIGLRTTDGGKTWVCGQHNTNIAAKHRPTGCK